MSRFTLRQQLLVFGLVGVFVPLAVILAVVFATESVDEIDESTGSRTVNVETTDRGVSPWVPITAGLLVVPAGAGVWWWSQRAVEPIERISGVANDIQAGSLDRRIALDGAATEVQALADSFDSMLERLERASATQRQLIEDTSHELRTPLTVLAANTELLLGTDHLNAADLRDGLRKNAAQIDRLQRSVDDLLRDARRRGDNTRQVDNDLAVIVERVAAEQRSITPDVSVVVACPEELLLGIDGASVERAIANLVRNAAEHSPAGAPVELSVSVTGSATEVRVTDRGPGVDPGDRHRIFERYERGDADSPGHGIGLALVKQVADAYGGVTLESPLDDAGGTAFTLRLPAPPAVSD